ncbi:MULTISPECIES: hydroxymethylglutaryl-CoA lyase [unclassified Bacillus (in: firmicutes)]|uniref:hydroxymethylglutaryl-CoA lyase n=1 Tax=unclassified Bacillus (in: firmicutes) TaxID=185979 RepID=UPI0008E654EE|nr:MULTISPECIES: hydroxymethylglutaryl-CoA lyase [unclassified Bacillus (in: firmicutes)]SFA97559.1 hydroxymethylglutaryl-CoA lyase [Bacillus sp. UNCCL13]SFQ80541.1 hydroxymethylglutaryl-CoA lyase [Bacillus sp. cl95]
MTLHLPKDVTIIEVGPRDGLQNEKGFIPTEAKINFIKGLKEAGMKEMELTSLVSPKWVPQMSDANEIISECLDEASRNFVLAPNQKGIDRLLETDCRAVAVFVGVSNTFNQKNINKTTAESMEELKPIIASLKEKGLFVRACISTAFYCPYEGKILEDDTLKLCGEFVEAGVDELSVADTIGMAAPTESYSLFSKLKSAFPNVLLTAHFHDTRKLAVANILAALQAGIDRFDTSAGGLGGCPFAPGASGNAATEDVVYMLERMGIRTGIDLNKIIDALNSLLPHLSRNIDSAFYKLNAVHN